MMLYQNAREANDRLKGCMIFYQGRPHIVQQATDNRRGPPVTLHLSPCFRGDWDGLYIQVPLDSRDLNYTSMKLGYVNDGREAVYLMRRPVRRYRQGINGENLTSSLYRFNPEVIYHTFAANRLSNLSREVAANLSGVYPAYEAAVEAVIEGDAWSRAFTRELAVEGDRLGFLTLCYKGERVAAKFREDANFRLPKRYHFLAETLEQERVSITKS